MSCSVLFSPNDYNLFCNTITASGGETIAGNLAVDGNLTVNGSINIPGPNEALALGGWVDPDVFTPGHIKLYQDSIGFGVSSPGSMNIITVGGGSINQVVGNTVISTTNANGINVASGGLTFGSNTTTPYQLNFYEHQNITATFTGPWATSQTASVNATRVGNMVMLTVNGISAPANTGTFITGSLSGGADFLPDGTITGLCVIVNNSVNVLGAFVISGVNDIIITPYVLPGGTFDGSFINTGNAGFTSFTMTYSLT